MLTPALACADKGVLSQGLWSRNLMATARICRCHLGAAARGSIRCRSAGLSARNGGGRGAMGFGGKNG